MRRVSRRLLPIALAAAALVMLTPRPLFSPRTPSPPIVPPTLQVPPQASVSPEIRSPRSRRLSRRIRSRNRQRAAPAVAITELPLAAIAAVTPGQPIAVASVAAATREPIGLAIPRTLFDSVRFPQLGPRRLPAPVSGNRPMYAMYAAFAGMQALDAYSTLTAVDAGARESNPVLRGLADKPAALIATKVSSTVLTIYAMEKLRKRSPLGAAITMAAIDSALAAVVAHNTTVGRRQAGR